MVKYFFVVLIFLSTKIVFAQDNSIATSASSEGLLSKTIFSSDFSMGGANFSEGQDESQFVQLIARPRAVVNFSKSFSVRADTMLILNTSRVQTRYQNPTFNTINLMELVGSYHPSDLFILEAGSINQDHLSNRMLIADRSFPGVMVASGYFSKDLKLKAKVQYAIPTSTSFESDRTEAEELPAFQTEGIEAFWKPKKWFSIEADINHFTYSKLPSVVAYQSGRLGNQVRGTDPSESFFVYDYQGFSQAYTLSFQYNSKISQSFRAAIVENSKAPSDRKRSQWVGTRLGLDFNPVKVSPVYAKYFAESDSVPAVYSAFELGRSNRDGELIGMKLDFKSMGFSVSTNYYKSNLIQANAPQGDMDFLEILLEVTNVSL